MNDQRGNNRARVLGGRFVLPPNGGFKKGRGKQIQKHILLVQ